MTPDRFRECLDAIGWTGRELGRQLGVDERQVRRWASNTEVPDQIAEWIERLAQFHKANFAPRRAGPPTVQWDEKFPPPDHLRRGIEITVLEAWKDRPDPETSEIEVVLHQKGSVTAYGDKRGLVLTCQYQP